MVTEASATARHLSPTLQFTEDGSLEETLGLYIDNIPAGPLPAKGKADFLLTNAPEAREVGRAPFNWLPNLVCVVDNGPFEAAAYCDTADEFRRFSDRNDPRPKRWLMVPGVKEWAR